MHSRVAKWVGDHAIAVSRDASAKREGRGKNTRTGRPTNTKQVTDMEHGQGAATAVGEKNAQAPRRAARQAGRGAPARRRRPRNGQHLPGRRSVKRVKQTRRRERAEQLLYRIIDFLLITTSWIIGFWHITTSWLRGRHRCLAPHLAWLFHPCSTSLSPPRLAFLLCFRLFVRAAARQSSSP